MFRGQRSFTLGPARVTERYCSNALGYLGCKLGHRSVERHWYRKAGLAIAFQRSARGTPRPPQAPSPANSASSAAGCVTSQFLVPASPTGDDADGAMTDHPADAVTPLAAVSASDEEGWSDGEHDLLLKPGGGAIAVIEKPRGLLVVVTCEVCAVTSDAPD